MRRFGRILLGVLGVLVLVLGGLAAAYIGSGDLVRLPPRTVADGSPVTMVGWRLLGYRDTTVTVTASGSQGPLFLGAANPVDLTSYLGDRPVLDVRRVAPTGALTGERVGSGAASAPADPATAGFWTGSTSGAGEQRLDVPLTGDPVSVAVITPVGSTVSVGLGAVVPGAFRAAVVVAAVGLALLVIALLLARRARGRRADTAPRARGDEPATTSARPGMTTTARVGVLGGMTVLALGLSGCVALPPSVAEPTAGVTKLALSPGQVPAVLSDYDARNTATKVEIAKGADEKSWGAVDTGPVYAADVVSTAVQRVAGTSADAKPWTSTGTVVYSGRFDAYPMWAVVPVTWSREGSDPKRTIVILKRASVTEPWKMAINNGQETDLPAPLPDGTDATADAADTAAGAELMTKTARFLTDGTDPGFARGDVLTKQRDDNLAFGELKATLTCKPMVMAQRPGDSVRVVRTSAGRLVTVTMRCEQTIYAPDGQTIYYKPEYAKAYEATTASLPTLSRVLYASVTLHQGADNVVQVIGGRSDDIRAKDADWVQ